MTLPVETIAYVAGVIDANAIIRVRRTPEGTDLPVVAVHGAGLQILKELGKLTGTKVTTVTRDYHRAVCNAHCPDQHEHVLSVTGRWSVTGARATVLLNATLPFLRAQKDTATEVLTATAGAPAKGATSVKMKNLGWPC